jgi:hypothetical protein
MCARLLGALLVSCLPVLGVADEVAAQVARRHRHLCGAGGAAGRCVERRGCRTDDPERRDGEDPVLRSSLRPALSPVLRQGGVRLYLFRVAKALPEGHETIEQLGTLELDGKSASRFEGTPFPFDVRFIQSYVPAAPQTRPPPSPDGPCTQCCVRCDGIEACACAVKMGCGSCCCPEHCGCLDSPPTSTAGTTDGCSVGAGIPR